MESQSSMMVITGTEEVFGRFYSLPSGKPPYQLLHHQQRFEPSMLVPSKPLGNIFPCRFKPSVKVWSLLSAPPNYQEISMPFLSA
jgi:hypothetical protein